MKKVFSGLLVLLYLVSACGPNTQQSSNTKEKSNVEHSRAHDSDHEHEHDHPEEELADNEVTFSDTQAERVNLTLEKIVPQPFHQVIKTSGQLIAPVSEETLLVANTSGILRYSINKLTPGQTIQGGQTVAIISSKHIVEGDPIAKSQLQYDIAKKEFERAERLAKDTLISMADYNQAKLTYENARLVYHALSGQHSEKGVSIRSSTQGYIKNILVDDGAYVSVGQPILTLTKNKKIQLKADVSEQHAALVPQITSANFLPANSKESYSVDSLNGKLVSSGKTLGDSSFYIPVIFEFNNTGNFLAGSFVTVYLKTNLLKHAITVPLTAIVEEQGLYFVYVKDRAHVYRKKEIKKGADDGKRALVLSGLEPGEDLVATSAYHLKLASMSAAIPHGHSH